MILRKRLSGTGDCESMEKGKLSGPERRQLLKIARQAIETELAGLPFSIFSAEIFGEKSEDLLS